MEIEFKVYQRFSKDENFKHVGFERINNDGNWEYKRNGRNEWLLGIITDNHRNAEFKRFQFINKIDINNEKLYIGDIAVQTGDLHLVEWNKDGYYFYLKRLNGLNKNNTLQISYLWSACKIGNIFENPELLSV